MIRRYSKGILVLFLFTGLSLTMRAGVPKKKASGFDIRKILYGIASYYHKSLEGNRTYNGERYSNAKLTAAHKSLPMGTIVRVTDLHNHKTVIVKINDRLPQNSTRTIDLSDKAAEHLHLMSRGLTHVKIEVLKGYKLPDGPKLASL